MQTYSGHTLPGIYTEQDLLDMEEHGIPREWYNKIPHKQLTHSFAKALGIDPASVSMDTAGGRFTNYMLNLYKNANACEGMAILAYAIEDTVSRMYTHIWNGMKRTTTNPRDYVFFPLHILLDDDHADLLKVSLHLKSTSRDSAPALPLTLSDSFSKGLGGSKSTRIVM